MDRITELTDLIESWATQRRPIAIRGANGGKQGVDSLREFAGVMNFQTRMIMRGLDRDTPSDTTKEFWDAWVELGNNALGILNRRKLKVDHQDVTNLGM